jgi:hypothetical protein
VIIEIGLRKNKENLEKEPQPTSKASARSQMDSVSVIRMWRV